MQRKKRWILPLYLVELLLLIAAIILVVKFIPDFGSHPGHSESSQTTESSQTAESSKSAESSQTAEDDSAKQESKYPDEPGQTKNDTKSETKSKTKYNRKSDDAVAKETDSSTQTQAVYSPPTMIVASDLHYMSPTMTDFGKVLEDYTAGGDGRATSYLDPITDAFLEEVVVKKPSVLILSGDISQDGERVNHGELARKLRRVQKAGVPVLVIPGNHDINNPWAATYYGDSMVPTDTVDADGFLDIYHEFGYDQAAGRDENSLSYLYKLDDRYWLMMLDSCIYEPKNEVGGRIRRDTLTWMETWLEKAKEEHVTVIPVAHHNLLNESALYKEECTLENHREVTALLEKYNLPIYISGHLHLQRVKKNISGPTAESQYGIHEIVSGSLSISPCQYGILKWTEDGSLSYNTKAVDVAAWARKHQQEDENLLDFADYSSRFLADVISSQLYRSVYSIPKDRKTQMAALYGEVNRAYSSGQKVNAADIKADKDYFYWQRYLGETKWYDNLTAMLKDTNHDNNSLYLTAGKDFPRIKPKDECKSEE
ncbi:MAG: metallophosphoesterase [Clostridium sp.]